MLIVHNIDNNWPFKQHEYCCQIHTKRLQGEHCLNTTDTLKNDQTELMGVKKRHSKIIIVLLSHSLRKFLRSKNKRRQCVSAEVVTQVSQVVEKVVQWLKG